MNKHAVFLMLLSLAVSVRSMEQGVTAKDESLVKTELLSQTVLARTSAPIANLIAQGANPNYQNHLGASLLYQAIEVAVQSVSGRQWQRSIQVIKALLEAKADPNKATINGTTPLMLLTHSVRFISKSFLPYVEQAISVLISYGADQELVDKWGMKALTLLPADAEFNPMRVLLKQPEPFFMKRRIKKSCKALASKEQTPMHQ